MNIIHKIVKRFVTYIASIKDRNLDLLNEVLKENLKSILKTSDKNQNEFYKKLNKIILELKGTSAFEAIRIVESINKTKNLDGDVCEFGVAQGKTSKLIAFLIQNTKKKLYLYDSFSGLPAPTKEDNLKDDIFNLKDISKYEGKMSHPQEKVIDELSSIKFDKERYIINKGFFNEEFVSYTKFPKSVSFAYVDFDFFEPTKNVLKIIEKLLVKDGIIIVDDYDFFSTGIKKAVDEWLEKNKNQYSVKIEKTNLASFAIIEKKI